MGKTSYFWVILAAAIVVIFSPVLAWVSGWIFGFFLKTFIGPTVIATVNTMFGTAFSVEALPAMCGVIALIGHFFKPTGFSTNKEKN